MPISPISQFPLELELDCLLEPYITHKPALQVRIGDVRRQRSPYLGTPQQGTEYAAVFRRAKPVSCQAELWQHAYLPRRRPNPIQHVQPLS